MTPFQEMEGLAESVRSGDPAALDRMLVLSRSYMEPTKKNLFPGLVLTPMERRIANRLFQRPGEFVTQDQLMDAMYFDKPEGEPADHNIIRVYICKLRHKFEGTQFRIPRVREYGFGYVGEI